MSILKDQRSEIYCSGAPRVRGVGFVPLDAPQIENTKLAQVERHVANKRSYYGIGSNMGVFRGETRAPGSVSGCDSWSCIYNARKLCSEIIKFQSTN